MAYLLCAVVGMVTVLQAGINRRLADVVGFLGATLFSNFILFLLSIVVLIAIGLYQAELFQEWAKLRTNFTWWYLLPGLFGFLIVIGLPIAIFHLGASKVFVIFIAMQLLTSVFWDIFAEGLSISPFRLLGIGLVAMGAGLSLYN